MINDRPIQDPRLQSALNEIRAVLDKYDFPGTAMIISPEEAAFFYRMHAEWSAFRVAAQTPLGFRIYANSHLDGKEITEHRVEAACHTVARMGDYGVQTFKWMTEITQLLSRHGIVFDHTSFDGKPLGSITSLDT